MHHLLMAIVLCSALGVSAQSLKSEKFGVDPGWDAVGNRGAKKHIVAHQDFGYNSDSNFVGKGKGEIGGRIQRSTVPAYYADVIMPKTLNDKLSASGTFTVPEKSGGGLWFGWFKADQEGGSGRPVGGLGLDIGFKTGGGHLAVRLTTKQNRAAGMLVTALKANKTGGKPVADVMLQPDGTRYTWNLDYDPNGTNGKGQVRFVVRSDRSKPQEFEGKVFSFDLPDGYKEQGTTFDRFGILNIMKTGGTVTIYFNDLTHDGKREDFSTDPKWLGVNNHGNVVERDQVAVQDFGYEPKSDIAGGKPGEIGGVFWRTETDPGFYAARTSPLTLDNKLVAHGKVQMLVGAPDSNMYIGWFASRDKQQSPVQAGNFLGVSIGGPTRIGHYFNPAYTTSMGERGKVKSGGPIIAPGTKYEWSLAYDPRGDGEIKVTLGKDSVTLPFKPQARRQGAQFDHFGVLTSGPGGQMVKIYFDDLEYTAAP